VRSSPVAGRQLVVLDIDSTLINEEGLDVLASLAGAEIAQQVAAITDRAMAGELDFAESLTKRVSLLAGQNVSLLATVSSQLTLTPGAMDLITAVHNNGGVVGAVSGGFHELVDPLAREIGLDHWLANRFEVEGDLLTGRVVGDIVDAAAKAHFVTTWANHHGIPLDQTVAIGDGANDVDMFRVAGLAVSLCGKEVANLHADICVEERNLARVLDYLPPGGLVAHAEATVDRNDRAGNIPGGV
jgi:phosphoserine phosphatase